MEKTVKTVGDIVTKLIENGNVAMRKQTKLKQLAKSS